MGLKLSDVSPLAGMVTGSGIGKLMQQGLGGLIPMQIAKDAAKSEEERKKRDTVQFRKMNKGGKVSSASKRADGIAQRGKTRGRFV